MYRKGATKVHWSDWEIGEVYYREGGTQPFVLLSIEPTASWNTKDEVNYRCDYLNGTKNISDTKTCLIKAEIEGENKMADNNKLYQVKGEESYGVQIATNSEGKIVLEMKGSAQVKAFEKSELEEVMPYTVSVNFFGDKAYSFETDKGSVEVGDFIIRMDEPYRGSIGEVTELNTKSKSAIKRLDAIIMQGKRVN